MVNGNGRHQRKRTTKSRIKRCEIKYFLIITVVCLIVASVLAFITGRLPSLLDEARQTKEETEYIEKLQNIENETGRKYGKEEIEELIRKYGDPREKTR